MNDLLNHHYLRAFGLPFPPLTPSWIFFRRVTVGSSRYSLLFAICFVIGFLSGLREVRRPVDGRINAMAVFE